MGNEQFSCPLNGCIGVLRRKYEGAGEWGCSECKGTFVTMDCIDPECDGEIFIEPYGGEGGCWKCGKVYDSEFDTNFGTSILEKKEESDET